MYNHEGIIYRVPMNTHHYFSEVEEQFVTMTDFLRSHASKRLNLRDLETFLAHDGRKLLRQLLLAHLAERGVGDIGESVVGADGITRTHKRLRTKTMKTLFGVIEIQRLAYSTRHASSLFPFDAMLTLPQVNVSYTLQKHLILEVIKSSFDESRESLVRWTGVNITKEQAQRIILDAAQDFIPFYEKQCAHEHAEAQRLPLVVLTSDGKGVNMRTESLRSETQKRARRNTAKKRGDTRPAKRLNAKRIATVASVYDIARFPRTPEDILTIFFPPDSAATRLSRPHPKAKRLWASLTLSSEDVLAQIFEEALRRDPSHQKEWVVLVDGDLHQIKLFNTLARRCNVSLTIICDIVHVLEYLWKAGHVLYDEDTIAQWVHDALQRILYGKSSFVASGMRRSATCRHLSTSVREPIDICARYLRNHWQYLRYNAYLHYGYPIATGVIEGACRYLVKDRMEITGARWSLEGAEALLKLRAIKISGDFSEYWKYYEHQQYVRNHSRLYQNPSVLESASITDHSSS
jgi:hypothetical protein